MTKVNVECGDLTGIYFTAWTVNKIKGYTIMVKGTNQDHTTVVMRSHDFEEAECKLKELLKCGGYIS